MMIKTNKIEISLTTEEIRHFKIETMEEMKKQLDILESGKQPIGFTPINQEDK